MAWSRTTTLVLLVAVAVATTGCDVVTVSDDEPARDARPASARSTVGGVETWDLTGTPSAEAFGRGEGSSAAVYRSDRPRPVRVLLPGGRTLTVEDATSIDFRSFGADRPDNWAFGISAAGGGLRSTAARLDGILSDLGLATGSVADFSARASASQGPERVVSTSQKARSGGIDLGVRASWRPTAERGSVDVTGSWGASR